MILDVQVQEILQCYFTEALIPEDFVAAFCYFPDPLQQNLPVQHSCLLSDLPQGDLRNCPHAFIPGFRFYRIVRTTITGRFKTPFRIPVDICDRQPGRAFLNSDIKAPDSVNLQHCRGSASKIIMHKVLHILLCPDFRFLNFHFLCTNNRHLAPPLSLSLSQILPNISLRTAFQVTN